MGASRRSKGGVVVVRLAEQLDCGDFISLLIQQQGQLLLGFGGVRRQDDRLLQEGARLREIALTLGDLRQSGERRGAPVRHRQVLLAFVSLYNGEGPMEASSCCGKVAQLDLRPTQAIERR